MRLAFTQRDLVTPLGLPFDAGQLVADGGLTEIRSLSDDADKLGSADLELHIARPLFEMLNGLCYGVKVIDDRHEPMWSGYIHEVHICENGSAVGVTMDGMTNRIKCPWSGYENSENADSISGETVWVEDEDSQDVYGTIERIETLADTNATLALQTANRMLSQLAWPVVTQVQGAEEGTTLYCRGWALTLGWEYYARGALDWTIIPTGVGNLYSNIWLGALTGYSTLRQFFTVPGSGDPYYLDAIELMLDAGGGGGAGGSVEVIRGITNLGAPNPGGVSLGSHQLIYGGNFNWYRCPLEPKSLVVPGEILTMTCSYAAGFGSQLAPRTCSLTSPDPLPPRLYVNVPYGSDCYPTGVDNEWMPYRVHGLVDTTAQISTIAVNSEFLAGCDVQMPSGRTITPYCDGSRSSLDVIRDTLRRGTVNEKRLLGNITADRILHLYEEPSGADIEAAINLMPNPSFETNMTGWVWDGSGSSILQNGTMSVRGDYCASVVMAGAGPGHQVYATPTLVDDTVYTVSFYAKWISGSTALHSELHGAGAAIDVTLTADWQRFSYTGPADATSAVYWWLAGAGTFRLDCVQVEAKTYTTAYCDGSLGPGHHWTGTAHASTSYRDAMLAHCLRIDDKGRLWWNEQPFTRSPVGWWIRTRDLPLPPNAVVKPGFYFCDRATWSDGLWKPEARDTESPLLL
jgi:hypothetical protein